MYGWRRDLSARCRDSDLVRESSSIVCENQSVRPIRAPLLDPAADGHAHLHIDGAGPGVATADGSESHTGRARMLCCRRCHHRAVLRTKHCFVGHYGSRWCAHSATQISRSPLANALLGQGGNADRRRFHAVDHFGWSRSRITMQRLNERIALVTGSSRGIGAAIARLFATEGAKVAVHGRDANALSAVRAHIEQAGGVAIQVQADVTRFDELDKMRRQVEDTLGPIDILVANAGGSFTMPGPLEEISEDGWRASLEGNLTATFLTIKSVLPGMKERKAGNIITISSSAGRKPHPNAPIPYSAAKAGIQILTQDLAAQVGPFNIRANCIAPETILTERNQQRIPQAQVKAFTEMHPIKRLGTPEDVARAALFLASDASAWITGVIIDVAGGAVMTI